jgi:iron complex transport system substrate-binding protein
MNRKSKRKVTANRREPARRANEFRKMRLRGLCGPLLIALLLLSGCTGKPLPPPASSGAINRIISAAPSYTEIIAGLGLADKLIAADKYSRDVEGVRADLPEIDFFNPDLEAVAGLKPDIIISGEINTNGAADTPYQFFRRMNITVLELSTCNSIAEIYRDIAAIANALGAGARGEAMILDMRKQIEAVAAEAVAANAQNAAGGTGANRVTSVYFEIAPAPNMVSFGGNTYLNEMIEIAGARNVFAGEKRWFTPGPEAIVSANPDVIFILSANAAAAESAVAELKSRPGFSALNAVRQNRIYPINENRASRSSQNITKTLEEMYRAMY